MGYMPQGEPSVTSGNTPASSRSNSSGSEDEYAVDRQSRHSSALSTPVYVDASHLPSYCSVENQASTVVRLRGLPFDVKEKDIRDFFHGKRLGGSANYWCFLCFWMKICQYFVLLLHFCCVALIVLRLYVVIVDIHHYVLDMDIDQVHILNCSTGDAFVVCIYYLYSYD